MTFFLFILANSILIDFVDQRKIDSMSETTLKWLCRMVMESGIIEKGLTPGK